MNEQILTAIKQVINAANEVRSFGVGRMANIGHVRYIDDGSIRITILFPDMGYLMSVALLLQTLDYITIRIDGLYLMLTIRHQL